MKWCTVGGSTALPTRRRCTTHRQCDARRSLAVGAPRQTSVIAVVRRAQPSKSPVVAHWPCHTPRTAPTAPASALTTRRSTTHSTRRGPHDRTCTWTKRIAGQRLTGNITSLSTDRGTHRRVPGVPLITWTFSRSTWLRIRSSSGLPTNGMDWHRWRCQRAFVAYHPALGVLCV